MHSPPALTGRRVAHIPKSDLSTCSTTLCEASGRAIKVISLLLPALPRQHRDKIIFMRRPVYEVAASQLMMLQRQRAPGR